MRPLAYSRELLPALTADTVWLFAGHHAWDALQQSPGALTGCRLVAPDPTRDYDYSPVRNRTVLLYTAGLSTRQERRLLRQLAQARPGAVGLLRACARNNTTLQWSSCAAII